jgi:mRNA-degrading endonuclease toxin of MazEF toxin-antitoxin module
MTSPLNPRRGEVWLVDLDPTRGSEMAKSNLTIPVLRLRFDLGHFVT